MAISRNNSIFRSKAVEKYIQNREKSVLPRLITPPVFLLCWLIFTLLIAAGVIVWLEQVPLYITGSGIVLSPDQGSEGTAIIFLPVSASSQLHAGLPVQLQIGQSGAALNLAVTAVSQNVLSPEEAHQQYGIAITEPALPVTVQLGSSIPASLYAGSLVQAKVQVGSQSLLALFPVFNSLLKAK